MRQPNLSVVVAALVAAATGGCNGPAAQQTEAANANDTEFNTSCGPDEDAATDVAGTNVTQGAC